MLARGRVCAGVAMDGDETGVPRAAAVRLALLARVIRGRADFDPMMPPFITAYLSYLLPT